MFDLRELEKRLQTDAEERAEFVADPIGWLKGEGIVLAPKHAKQIADHMKKMRKKHPALLDKSRPNIDVEISVTIRY